MSIKILHIHPSLQMAKIFISPLMKAESKNGYITKLIVCENNHFIKMYTGIKKYNPDILISHNTTSSILPLLFARFLKIKKIVYFNHGVPFIGYRFPLKLILYKLEVINCCLADYVYTVSIDMYKILKKIKHNDLMLSNPGSVSGISFSKKKFINFRKIFNVNKETTVICFIGRPVARKGFHLILDVWEEFFLNNKNYVLFLCGPDQKDLRNHGLLNSNNIITLGFSGHVESVLKSSNFMVLPSYHEGLSYAVLESLSVKCPVITSNIPGIKSLIKHKFNGMLIDIENKSKAATRLYNTIIYLENNKSLVSKIKKNGLITAKKYTRKKVVASYIGNLNKIGEQLK